MNIVTCSKCGEKKESKKGNMCVDCKNAYFKEYYKKHAEEKKKAAREHSKTYYQENKAKKRRYALANWDKISTRMRQWYKDTIDVRWHKEAAKRQRRRALQKALPASFTHKEWKELCEKYDNRCLCCGVQGKMTPDHIVPLCKGGAGTIDNIQPLCRHCNCSKREKIIDYRNEQISFLEAVNGNKNKRNR